MRTLIFLLLSFPSVAWASCPDLDKAKLYYKVGDTFFKAEQFADALREFRRAHDLCPTSKMLFNLGQTAELANDTVNAIDYYRQYLQTNPTTFKDFTEERILDLEKKVIVKQEPSKEPQVPQVVKPHKPDMGIPPWTDPFAESVTQATHVKVSPPPPSSWKRPLAWVATGIGLGLVATGTTMLATRKVDEWRRNESTGKLETVTTTWWPGASLLGAGALAGGVGSWLFLTKNHEVTGVSVGGTF